MAHQIETMAYAGLTPWHGLGHKVTPHQPIEVWQRQAGMDWRIDESPVRFVDRSPGSLGGFHGFPDQKVLYRSDTKAALSVVSRRYKVVQPVEVLEFYRDLTEHAGYELETAGVLRGGRKFWALARSGLSSSLLGQDPVEGYLLLATSCDGSLATVATPTTVRVVCNNTLTMALDGNAQGVKVPHSTVFDADRVKRQLGVSVSQWDEFMYRMRALAARKVSATEAQAFFRDVISKTDEPVGERRKLPNHRALQRVHELYGGAGRGAELATAKGTAWGLLNAVTEFVDHERRSRSSDYRLDSAWFGQGAQLKSEALEAALALAA